MKKVLILSYFFPPANFVGADRTAAWYKYLPENNIYPIIITRQWNNSQIDITSKVLNNNLEIEKTNTGEIHRLPYKRTIRDILSLYPTLKVFQKAYTFFELILSNFFISALSFSNFYYYTKDYLKQNPDVQIIIASGRPFQSFFIGYKLKKDFPKIHWIPDYRDEWGSHQHKNQSNWLIKRINTLEAKSERKWTSNISCFVSVSPFLINSIQLFINKKGGSILNGFENNKFNFLNKKTSSQILYITYAGTLYPSQNIKVFLQSAKNLLRKGIKLKIYFIGINIHENQQLKKLMYSFEKDILIIPRIEKEKLFEYYAQADLFLLTSYNEIKGWYPVKLFEYYQTKKPILLCPSDNGVIEDFINVTNSGYIASSIQDCEEILESLYEKKKKRFALQKDINFENGIKYSRQYQTKLLAEYLKTLNTPNPCAPSQDL